MRRGIGIVLFILLLALEVRAASDRGFSVSVFVGGGSRCEYRSRGSVYVEALRGVPYALRLTNPLPRRVAVALSVDGLNTIDARRGSARDARKWVIEPYGSITIPGWQVSGEAARAFFFTGEKSSYGSALGRTEDLGVIEAVFFVERVPVAAMDAPVPLRVGEGRSGAVAAEPPAAASPAPEALRRDAASAGGSAKTESLSDELAATGMGDRRGHPVIEVAMDLDPEPAARVRLRYEFRPQLAALGIVPSDDFPPIRRERASGFTDFCPESAK